MDLSFSKRLYLISLFPNRIEDSKWLKKFCLQFPVLFDLDVSAIQSNFIIKSIAFRLDAFIVGLFLKFLGRMEVLFANNY